MLARSFLAAALALLISGDAARLGWEAFGAWHFIFPYLWLFLLLESGRARRRLSDGSVFLAGASMAMLYGAVRNIARQGFFTTRLLHRNT